MYRILNRNSYKVLCLEGHHAVDCCLLAGFVVFCLNFDFVAVLLLGNVS